MANNRWYGIAAAVAQYDTLTIGGTPSASDTVSVTIGGVIVTYTVTAADVGSGTPVNNVAKNFAALLASPTNAPMFLEVQYAQDPTTLAQINCVASIAGVDFTQSQSHVGATTLALAHVTANSGPNSADAIENWSTGALPTTADVVIIDGGPDILYGFANLTPAALTSIAVYASFQNNGNIGLPFRNANGYVEYRPRFWQVESGIPITIGQGSGNGPNRCNFQYLTPFVGAVTVMATGAQRFAGSGTAPTPVVNIIGNTSGTMSIFSGSVGACGDDDTLVSTWAAVKMLGGTFTSGLHATVTAFTQNGGTATLNGPVTGITQSGGKAILTNGTHISSGISSTGGIVDYRGGGNVGQLTFAGSGIGSPPQLILNNDPRAKSFDSGSSFKDGAQIIDPFKTLGSWGSSIAMDAASLNASQVGAEVNVTIS